MFERLRKIVEPWQHLVVSGRASSQHRRNCKAKDKKDMDTLFKFDNLTNMKREESAKLACIPSFLNW